MFGDNEITVRRLLELQLMLGGSAEESESGMLSRTFLLDALRHVSNPDQTLSRVRRDLQIELGLLPTHLRARLYFSYLRASKS